MTRYARLTWQVPEPAAFAASLASRLGVEAWPGTEVPGVTPLTPATWIIDLRSAWLEVRPWVSEGPGDRPAPGGRLMLEPVPGGEPTPDEVRGADVAGADAGPDAADGDAVPVPTLRLAAIGWATVELDRAEEELGMWLGGPRTPVAPVDPQLGAHAGLREAEGLPGDAFVLLEPNTEGRLAASLARDGEGPCALYLRPAGGLAAWVAAARERGVALSTRRRGPLGPQVLLARGPIPGPHLLLVD